ncbi:MAG TPA: nucleotidyltransferase domain-containing protein [Candidatus Omnitrophota bacterium]|nr:nucleotidyltransferase domain-containing protein [Candidatus Omnitrophota bacterium]
MIRARSQTKTRVLNYFFLNEEKQAYINELARLIEADPKNVFRILVQLQQEGLLKSEFRGKERFFSVNKGNPLYKHYKEIFLKTAGFEHGLSERLKTVKNLKEAYIFGSYANGRYEAMSDIDILLVGTHSSIEAQKAIYGLQKETGREINVIDITPQELAKNKKQKDEFIKNIFDGKTVRLL